MTAYKNFMGTFLRLACLISRKGNDMKCKIIVLLLFVSSLPVSAQRQLSVTVYNQNFAVIKDSRNFTLKPNQDLIRFSDIAANIDPTSVQIQADSNPKFSVIEQNFEYDLVSTTKLLARMIDNPITIVLKNGRVFKGRLLSSGERKITIRGSDGQIKIINRGKSIYQIILPELPDGLLLRPELIWKVTNHLEKEKIEIAYQSSGFGWHADYNVMVHPERNQLDINGWVTITNRSGASFPDAGLKLVAGDVHKVKENKMPVMDEKSRMYKANAIGAAPPPGFVERSFAEYHLYDLGRKTTLKNNETKQIELFEAKGIAYSPEYLFEEQNRYSRYYYRRYPMNGEQESATPLNFVLAFRNKKENQLGIPLPAGKVRLYQQDKSGIDHFIGQDNIEHTPKDEELRVTVGKAFDVVGRKKIIARKKISDSESTEDISILIRNHKDKSIPIVIREKLYGNTNWSIENNNIGYKKIDYHTIEFRFDLSAESQKDLRFRVRYKRYKW